MSKQSTEAAPVEQVFLEDTKVTFQGAEMSQSMMLFMTVSEGIAGLKISTFECKVGDEELPELRSEKAFIPKFYLKEDMAFEIFIIENNTYARAGLLITSDGFVSIIKLGRQSFPAHAQVLMKPMENSFGWRYN